MRTPKTTVRIDKLIEIANPTINMIEANMQTRCKVRGKDYGLMIAAVDHEAGKVLVGRYIGGTAEDWKWLPVNCVQIVWMAPRWTVDNQPSRIDRKAAIAQAMKAAR